MDAGLAVVLAGAVGVLGTIAGASLQFILSRQGAREDREAGEARERAARLRDFNLRRIDETRVQMIAYLDGLTNALDQDLTKAKKELAKGADASLANARLLGDLDAAVTWADALASIYETWPTGRLRGVIASMRSPVSPDQRRALGDARVLVLAAAARQQERAIRDEPLLIVDPDAFNARLDAGRLAEVERRWG